MIINPIALGKEWSGPLPQLAWVLLLQEMPGKAMNVQVKAAQRFTGDIDMQALLDKKPVGSFDWTPGENKHQPTAISMRIDADMYVGFILSDKMGVEFDDMPFSGGAANSAEYWVQPTKVSAKKAFLMVKGAQFDPSGCFHPFNIHLNAKGTFADGTPYCTPIILDPDGRQPDGGNLPPV